MDPNTEEELLRSVALENAKSILRARNRAEAELVQANAALEKKTQELAHSLAVMTATLESTTDGILVTDREGKITGFNERYIQMWRLTHDFMEASDHKQILELTSAGFDEPDRFLAKIDEIYQASMPESYDVLELADGRVLERFSRVQVVEDQNVGRVWSFRDITERRRIEEVNEKATHELRQLAATLSEADRRKNEFLAMLAHELRNPLAPIRNALQILRMSDGGAEMLRGASEIMERQVNQLVRLVDDLLDVSRISRGKIELRREQLSLASVIKDAVEAVLPTFEAAGIELNVDVPETPINLSGDPDRLVQVIGNLLNNSSKFTERGGSVSLSLEMENADALVRVQDTGIGIAPNQILHIFDMFVQADTSLERSVSGLGIGLTLVKKLVQMHGGSVEAHSEGLGQGSEFIVRIPLHAGKADARPVPVSGAAEKPGMVRQRILVVDDNVDSAESLAMLLEITGHEVQIAYDGLEAVKMAGSFLPQVVLLDIGLPTLNGFEAAREIRRQPWGKDMALIALTGWGQQEDRQNSTDAGFDRHMVKPVDHGELMKQLDELAGRN